MGGPRKIIPGPGEDWWVHQARSVRETLAVPSNRGGWRRRMGGPTASLSPQLRTGKRIGEIVMLAVDPADQRQGLGRALADHASDWLRDISQKGGGDRDRRDPHPPAPRMYERSGYRLMPATQYSKVLEVGSSRD